MKVPLNNSTSAFEVSTTALLSLTSIVLALIALTAKASFHGIKNIIAGNTTPTYNIRFINTKTKGVCLVMEYSLAVEKFLRYLQSIDRSWETLEAYKKELGYFGDFLLERYSIDKRMNDITLEDLEDYMYHIKEKGKMDSTRNRVIYIFRSLYKYACKRDFCVKDLPIFLEPIRVKKRERTFLEEEEVEEIFKHIDHPILKAAIQTMFYTGVRVSELINLKLEDIDMDSRLIYVISGKGNKDRVVPISKKLYSIINNYMEHIRPETESDRVFCTKKTGAISAPYINLVLKRAQQSMGLEKNISSHILRHSFASNLIKANVPLPYLQKLLGHADLRVTSVYIHQSMEQLRDAIELI